MMNPSDPIALEELAATKPDEPLKRLPAGVTMPTVSYLELDDMAFQDRTKVEGIQHAYEYMTTGLQQELQEMLECGDFVVGNQWRSSDEEYQRKQGRIPRVFNMVLPQVLAYEGTTLGARSRMKAYARGEEDVATADLHTEVLNYFLDETRYYYQLKRVASDAVIFRRGYMSFTWEYTGRHPDGRPAVRRTNPFDHRFDFENTDIDINRSRRHIYTRFLDADRIIQLYVNNNPSLAEYLDRRAIMMEGPRARERRKRSGVSQFREYSGGPTQWTANKKTALGSGDNVFSESGRPSTDYYDAARGMYRVIEYAERRMVVRKAIFDPVTGENWPIAPTHEKRPGFVKYLLDLLELDEGAVRERVMPEYWVMAAAPGLADDVMLIEVPYSVQDPFDDLGIAHKITLCYDQHPDKAKHLGMVDLIRDPQEALNRRWSSKDDALTGFLNPRVVGYSQAFGKYYNDWVKGIGIPGSVLRLDGAPGQYPKPELVFPPAGMAQLLDGDIDLLMRFMEQSTGVNQNLRGFQQSGQESGAAFEYRAQRGETMIEPIVDNLKTSMLEHGSYLHSMLCTHLTEPRVLRIVGEDGIQKWMTVNGQQQGGTKFDVRSGFSRYDIRWDQSAYTPTARARYYAEWSKWLEGIGDPLLRAMLMTTIVPLSTDTRKYEVVEQLKKWLVMQAGPQILLPLPDMVAMMTGGAPAPTADGGAAPVPIPPDMADPELSQVLRGMPAGPAAPTIPGGEQI